MKQKPIFMSTPMVMSTMEDRKTVTRRKISNRYVINDAPDKYISHGVNDDGAALFEDKTPDITEWMSPIICPYGKPGNILWVRETWNTLTEFTRKPEYNVMDIGDFVYKAGDIRIDKWRTSIFMPKQAARLWLEVTDIKVERIQDITEEEALSEGVQFYDDDVMGRCFKNYIASSKGYGDPEVDYPTVDTARTSFGSLWLKINGEKTWMDNVWVWAISYKVLSKTGKPACNSVGETL